MSAKPLQNPNESRSPRIAGRHHGLLRLPRTRFSLRRMLFAGLGLLGGVFTLALVVGSLFAVRLNQGPIALDWLGPKIKTALDGKLKSGYSFDMGDAALEKGEHGPAVTVKALQLRDPAGRVLLSAPRAEVAVNGLAAAVGAIVPTRLELTGLEVRFVIGGDGAISVSAGGGEGLPLALLQRGSDPSVASSAAAVAAARELPVPGQEDKLSVRAARALRSLLDSVGDKDSPFGALDHFSVVHGRLVFDDAAAGTTTVLDGLSVTFDRTGGEARLALSVNGPAGVWSLSAQTSGQAGWERRLQVEVRDISLDEIELAFGVRGAAFESDMPVSAGLTATLAPDNSLAAAQVKFSAGAGIVKLVDPDQEPWLVDEISGMLTLDPQSESLRVEKLRLDAGLTHFDLQGNLTPPTAGSRDWGIEFSSGDSAFGPERPGETAIVFTRLLLAAAYNVEQHRLAIEKFEFEGPEIGGKLSALLTGLDARPTFKLDGSLRRMQLRTVLRLWPGFAAPATRAWFLAHLHAGTLESGSANLDYDADMFAAARAKTQLPDRAGHFDFAVSGVTLETLPGIPPLSSIDGSGRVLGHSATFAATRGGLELGGGKKLNIPEMSFSVKDFDAKPAPATLTLRAQGNIEAVAALLARDALKSLHALPPEAQNLKGQVDGQLIVDLRLAKKMGPEDIAVRATGNLTGLTIDNFLGKEKLENGALAITFSKDGIRAKGEARVLGGAVSLEVKKPMGAAGEAVAQLTLDEAARSRLGIAAGLGLTGPVLARVTGNLSQGGDAKARVELDLSRATIDNLLPGWSKPAGKAGKASFALQSDEAGLRLEQIALDAGGVSFGGSAQLTAEGRFVSAHITKLKLGIGEDMQADASLNGETLKLALKGASIDARPFLNALVSQQAETRGPRDLDLDLRANALLGHNRQTLANAEIKMARRAGQLRSLAMSGRFGEEPVSVSLIKRDGPASIVVRSQDAGATLAFLDLYRNMRGGLLDMTMRLGDRQQDGTVAIHDFTLKDEPAMRRLMSNGAVPAGAASSNGQIDASSVPFTKLTASFSRTGGRTDIRDGVMFGQQIGATLSGSIDFSRNTVDINGAFVPAYGVNNLFARVPLLGPLLGGNKNEGLFAINYRVTGLASAPVLHINPLSAIAPGFLRTIFGAVDGTRPAGPVGEAVVVPPR